MTATIEAPTAVGTKLESINHWLGGRFRHIYGPEGIDFHTRIEVVTSRRLDPGASRADLGLLQAN